LRYLCGAACRRAAKARRPACSRSSRAWPRAAEAAHWLLRRAARRFDRREVRCERRLAQEKTRNSGLQLAHARTTHHAPPRTTSHQPCFPACGLPRLVAAAASPRIRRRTAPAGPTFVVGRRSRSRSIFEGRTCTRHMRSREESSCIFLFSSSTSSFNLSPPARPSRRRPQPTAV
jgi:hypothetical protein